MRTCSAGRAERARPRRHACSPRRFCASRPKTDSPMAPARSASRLPRVRTPMSSSLTLRVARVSTTCARRSSDAWGLPRRAAVSRSISSTRCICCRRRRSTRCSRRSKSRPSMSSSCCARPIRIRFPRPSSPAASASTSVASPSRRSWAISSVSARARASNTSPRRSSSSPRSPPAACVMPPRRSSRSASIPKARSRLTRPRACSVKSTLRHSSK